MLKGLLNTLWIIIIRTIIIKTLKNEDYSKKYLFLNTLYKGEKYVKFKICFVSYRFMYYAFWVNNFACHVLFCFANISVFPDTSFLSFPLKSLSFFFFLVTWSEQELHRPRHWDNMFCFTSISTIFALYFYFPCEMLIFKVVF